MSELDVAWREAIRDGVRELRADETALREHVNGVIAAGALTVHAADVVLAWAVARGDKRALARFEHEVASEIAAAAKKLDRDPTFVDEVGQLVRVRILVGEAGTPPRIASYRGAGPLRAWVAIAALRIALNAKRDAPAAGDVLGDVVDREPDPELRHLKTLYRAEYREALAAAIAALPDRDRALLRMRFVSGLELAKIGGLYRVHESTASRWIAAAVETVGSGARKRLVERLQITAATADSVARMVASQLDLSIARLL